jgi:hypothetical protein
VNPLFFIIGNKNTAGGRIRPTARSAKYRTKCPVPVCDPFFCLRDSAAPSGPPCTFGTPFTTEILGIFLRFLFHGGSRSFNRSIQLVSNMPALDLFVNKKAFWVIA